MLFKQKNARLKNWTDMKELGYVFGFTTQTLPKLVFLNISQQMQTFEELLLFLKHRKTLFLHRNRSAAFGGS